MVYLLCFHYIYIYIWLLKQWLTSTLNKNQTLQSSTENDGWAISIPLAEFYFKKKSLFKAI